VRLHTWLPFLGCSWEDIPGPKDLRDEEGNTWLRASGNRAPRLVVFQRCRDCGDYRAMVVSPEDHESRYSRPQSHYHELSREDILKLCKEEQSFGSV
jgi:hypothetical protein